MIRNSYSLFNYLTIADSDKLWGLYVTGSGSADLPPHTPYPPAKHPDGYMFDWRHGRILSEFQILYLTRGKGVFESRAVGRKEIGEGDIILLFPGVWHRYMPDKGTGWKEHWVSFNGAQPERFVTHDLLSPDRPVINIGLNEEIIGLYRQISELMESERIGYRQIISALTYQIIAQLLAL
ncbi:MAG TPA: AraC family transcriptional regulator, partial [bacterium]|nr:AraC family transcriptional regulator [bacterium]